MGKNILYNTIGYKKSKWVYVIVLGVLAFCLFFAWTYSGFFGHFLTLSIMGISNIPAKILAVVLVVLAWSSWNT